MTRKPFDPDVMGKHEFDRELNARVVEKYLAICEVIGPEPKSDTDPDGLVLYFVALHLLKIALAHLPESVSDAYLEQIEKTLPVDVAEIRAAIEADRDFIN